MNRSGTMYALEAETGDTLWTFESGGSVNTAPAIVDGTVYWGSGYGTVGLGLQANNVLYAFELDAEGSAPMRDSLQVAADGGTDSGASGARQEGVGGVPTWSTIYGAYLTAGTPGHCPDCHIEMADRGKAYAWLTAKGQINQMSSLISVRGSSRLTIFGGGMPPNGPASLPQAEADISAWVAAGAAND